MTKLIKFINKYWLVLTACGTILTSGITIIVHLKGRIDFQIQQQTEANEQFKGKREALLWIYRE
jgi:hypothetical protein